MKISVFYENILEGLNAHQIDMRDALKQLKQIGMGKVYFSYDTLKNDEGKSVLKMIQKLELGVEGLYGFFEFSHFPLDDGYKKMIDLAVEVKAGNVLLVPGFIADEAIEAEILDRNMKTGLMNAVQYGKVRNIDVSIEDFDGLTAPYCRITGVADYLENVSGLKLSFDTGNFVMHHDDEFEAFRLFKEKICTVHLKDRSHKKIRKNSAATVCADGEKVYTVPVGDGFIQIREIMAELKKSGYDGGLIAELYGYCSEDMFEGIQKSVRWIKETWENI